MESERERERERYEGDRVPALAWGWEGVRRWKGRGGGEQEVGVRDRVGRRDGRIGNVKNRGK